MFHNSMTATQPRLNNPLATDRSAGALNARAQQTLFSPSDYYPNDSDDYMSPQMVDYFKCRLLLWRQELDATIQTDQQELEFQESRQADDIDDAIRKQAWMDRSQQLLRHHQFQQQIDAALKRIAQGIYGYCEQTGETIGVDRLLAWPIAQLSLRAQAQQEQQIKMKQAYKRRPL